MSGEVLQFGVSRRPGEDHAKLMSELKELARNARGRLVDEFHNADSDGVVRALGGSFKKEREIKAQGGHLMIVLRGANGRVAVVNSTSGIVNGKIRVFEKGEE